MSESLFTVGCALSVMSLNGLLVSIVCHSQHYLPRRSAEKTGREREERYKPVSVQSHMALMLITDLLHSSHIDIAGEHRSN